MVIPARAIIADSVNEATNKPQITLCDGTNPDVIEDDVDIKITKIRPERIDKIIEMGERGEIPYIPDNPTPVKRDRSDPDIEKTIEAEASEPTPIKLNQSCWRHYCHYYFDSHAFIETFIIGFEVKGVNQYIVAQAVLYHKGYWKNNYPESETIDIYVYDDNKKQTVNLFEGNKSTKIWINGWVEHAYPQEKLNSIAAALHKHIQNADPKIDLTQPNFWLLEPSDWLTFKHLGNSPPDIDCNLLIQRLKLIL